MPAVVTATTLYEGQPRLLCEASLKTVSIYPSFEAWMNFSQKIISYHLNNLITRLITNLICY